MTFPIPRDAFDDRLAIVGTAGSGKTYAALGACEHLLARNSRLIFIDPLGVAWGLRLCSDGRTTSPFQPVIFGGLHGDLLINEHAGALIGETVATMRESCIIDLGQLGTKASERRFMLAFLTALYRHTNKEPVHLIIDESDMFAPQKLLDKDGDAAKLLGMMETIVRRGRVKGFIPWLITQRPAVLSKDILSQADGLIALKLTADHDRKAIRAWVESTADPGQWKLIDARLPTFQRGLGVLWIPARGMLHEVEFPSNATYDSSRTPKRGEKRQAAELKSIDLTVLRDKLGKIEQEAKANDPRELRAEITRLTGEVRRLSRGGQPQAPASAAEDPKVTDRAYVTGFFTGDRGGYLRALAELMPFVEGLRNSSVAAASALEALRLMEKKLAEKSANMQRKPTKPDAPERGGQVISATPARGPITLTPPRQDRAAPPTGDHALTGPQRSLLQALAWWGALGHDTVSRAQLAAKAGWSVNGGHFINRLSELSRAGLILYPSNGMVTLTASGRDAAPEPDMGRSLIESIQNSLTGPQRVIFDQLLTHHGRAVTREALAASIGWGDKGGHFINRLSELSRLQIITYPARGEVALQDWIR